ncbi:TPA: Rpn family recombination-promoting nuclease/putative transposase [Klebsiella oxytoca]|nr:Rpn family recombination-promoting nuclease/putative transposase [Klebsiella oxytoca]
MNPRKSNAPGFPYSSLWWLRANSQNRPIGFSPDGLSDHNSAGHLSRTGLPVSLIRELDRTELFGEPDLARRFLHQPFPQIDLTAMPDDEMMDHGNASLMEYLPGAVHRRNLSEVSRALVRLTLRNNCTPL